MFKLKLPRNGWSVVGVGQDAREKLIAVSHAAINCLEAISERYSNGEEIGESEYLCTGRAHKFFS